MHFFGNLIADHIHLRKRNFLYVTMEIVEQLISYTEKMTKQNSSVLFQYSKSSTLNLLLCEFHI